MDTDTRYGLLITVYACYWLRPVLFRIWTQCAFDWAADSGEALGEALGDILVPLLLDRLSVRCYACEATSLRKPLPVWVDVQETVGDHTHFVIRLHISEKIANTVVEALPLTRRKK